MLFALYKYINELSIQLGYHYPEGKIKDNIGFIKESNNNKMYVAEIDNKIVGYIHAQFYQVIFQGPLLNVLGLVVNENYRKQGIGKNYYRIWKTVERVVIVKEFDLTQMKQEVLPMNFITGMVIEIQKLINFLLNCFKRVGQ